MTTANIRRPLILSVSRPITSGSSLSVAGLRTNGQPEEFKFCWFEMASFLEALHGQWDKDVAAMNRFVTSVFPETTTRTFLNWVEADRPEDIEAFCKQNISEVIDERMAYCRAKAEQPQDVAPLIISTEGWQNVPREFSIETTLELNLNQRFPRA